MNDIYERPLIFKIAAAVSMADVSIDDKDMVEIPEFNKEYKYAQTVEVDGERVAMCSKDLKEWCLCIAVRMFCGDEFDAKEFIKRDYEVRKAHWGGKE